MTSDETRAREQRAIEEASEELGLASWYRSCVGPLLHLHEDRFPSCCGGQCEPCNQVLTDVALRARRILGIDETGRALAED